jgi:hypothetical protein
MVYATNFTRFVDQCQKSTNGVLQLRICGSRFQVCSAVNEKISGVHIITSPLADERSHVCCPRAFDFRQYHTGSTYHVTDTDCVHASNAM